VPIILPRLRDAAHRGRCAFVRLIPARERSIGTRVYTVLVRVTNRGGEIRVLKAALRYSSVRKSIRSTTCGAGFHARLWK
jgi:hypothetical protein